MWGAEDTSLALWAPRKTRMASPSKRCTNQLASLGFIDDTICLTRTKEDMAIQLRKIEAFSSPSGYNLPVNNTKSTTTAILHGTAAANGGPADEPSRLKSLLRLRKKLHDTKRPTDTLLPPEQDVQVSTSGLRYARQWSGAPS